MINLVMAFCMFSDDKFGDGSLYVFRCGFYRTSPHGRRKNLPCTTATWLSLIMESKQLDSLSDV